MQVILNLTQGRAFRHDAEKMERGVIVVMTDSQTDQVFDHRDAAFVIVAWESGEEAAYAVGNRSTPSLH